MLRGGAKNFVPSCLNAHSRDLLQARDHLPPLLLALLWGCHNHLAPLQSCGPLDGWPPLPWGEKEAGGLPPSCHFTPSVTTIWIHRLQRHRQNFFTNGLMHIEKEIIVLERQSLKFKSIWTLWVQSPSPRRKLHPFSWEISIPPPTHGKRSHSQNAYGELQFEWIPPQQPSVEWTQMLIATSKWNKREGDREKPLKEWHVHISWQRLVGTNWIQNAKDLTFSGPWASL